VCLFVIYSTSESLRHQTRHYVDIHLSAHVHDLTNLIRDSAIVLYFQPFATIKLERMGLAFGWTVEEVERHVVALIQSGDIQGRVDSQNKVSCGVCHFSLVPTNFCLQILQAKKTDYRADLFARAIRAGTEMQMANRKLLLRMRLSVIQSTPCLMQHLTKCPPISQQADLVVRAPKGSHHSSVQLNELLQGD
jgi:COP9 signalosome complex subunit 1